MPKPCKEYRDKRAHFIVSFIIAVAGTMVGSSVLALIHPELGYISTVPLFLIILGLREGAKWS